MHTRGQRFVFALRLHDHKCWHSTGGHAYKQFAAWGFDVSLVEESDFLEEDIRHSGRMPGKVPTRRITYSVSNHGFDLRLVYTIQFFDKSSDKMFRSSSTQNSVNLACSVDDQNAFDYWLDEKVYQRSINLCTPDETMDVSTGSKEVRIPLEDGVARYVAKPDGSSELSMPGKKLSIMPDGRASVQMDQIDKVKIDNLADVKSYSVASHNNRTFHVFEFTSGGTGEIVYGPTGKLEVFQVQGSVAVGNREVTLFGSKMVIY